MLRDSVRAVTSSVLEPLCEETQKIFRPMALAPRDRMRVSLDRDGKKFVAHIYGLESGTNAEGYPSYNAHKVFPLRVPERKQLPGYSDWEFAGTDFTALLINQLWPAEQVTFDDEARILFDYLLSRFMHQTQGAKRRAAFAANGALPAANLLDHSELPLAPYQRLGCITAIGQEASALFMEQGTGKTPIVIARICNEARRFRNGEADVLAVTVREASVAAIEARAVADVDRRVAELARVAQEKADARRKALLEAAGTKTQHRETALKKRLGLALGEATEGVLGDAASRVQGVNEQAADAMVRGLFREQAQNDLENAKLEADTIEADLLKEAELTGKAYREAMMRVAKVEIAKALAPPAHGSKKRMYRVLIVAPKSVRTNWRNEFVRFATVPGKVTVLRGGELERVKLLCEAMQYEDDCEWSAVVCSYEAVIRAWEALRMMEWDLCVLDESHYIKSVHTKRIKTILKLRERCSQRMCLTGTPITNWLLDVYSQLEFLGEGLSGFSNWHAFSHYYGKWVTRGRFDALEGYKNVPLLQERLARLAFMIRKDQALPDLPEKMPDVVDVEMTKEQADIYDKVQQRLVVEIEADLAAAEATGNKTLTVSNILTKLLRLAQITSGFVSWDAQYTDDGDVLSEKQVDRLDPNPKLDALVELLRNKTEHEKTVVWACWVQDIKSIAARLRLENIDCVTYYGGTSENDRESAVQRFNTDPVCRVFVGNPSAGGAGINLLGYDYEREPDSPYACNHVIYYSQTWSMVTRAQSEDRSHRRGTRSHVRYTDLCVPNSIDEEIRTRVTQKRIMAYAIQDIRSILDRVLHSAVDAGD